MSQFEKKVAAHILTGIAKHTTLLDMYQKTNFDGSEEHQELIFKQQDMIDHYKQMALELFNISIVSSVVSELESIARS